MKRVSAVLISVLLVLISIPSVRSRADGVNFFKVITPDIIAERFPSQYSVSWVANQFQKSESYFAGYDFELFNDLSIMDVNPLGDRVLYSLGAFNAATGNTQLVIMDLSHTTGSYHSAFVQTQGITVVFDEEQPSGSYVGLYSYLYNPSTGWAVYYGSSTQGINSTPKMTFTFASSNTRENPNKPGIWMGNVGLQPHNNEMVYFANYGSSLTEYMYYTNCEHYYSSKEFWDLYYNDNTALASSISNYFGVYSILSGGKIDTVEITDYAYNSPYWDGNEIIDPSGGGGGVVIEDNTNHLFLTNFDTGFCKPYSLNDLYRAGGGYAYFSYNFDSWINSHSSQYELHVQTTLNVDNTEYIYNIVKGLDLQGLNVFSLKELASSYSWEYENMLFVEYPDVLFNNYNRGYLYSMTYTNAYWGSSTNFISRALSTGGRSNRLFYSSNGSTRQLTSSQPDSNIENIWVGEERTKFLITFDIVLYDNISHESSDHFTETHNLITGTSTVSSNGISDNKNPFENYNGDDPYLPVDDSGGGYSVSQSYGYVNNINIPSNYTVTYRDGVNTFIDWYNQDPSSTGIMNSFWGMMGVFRNNPATDIYEDYWGFLPSGFKSLVLACASLGIIGFAATVLRKRLMR